MSAVASSSKTAGPPDAAALMRGVAGALLGVRSVDAVARLVVSTARALLMADGANLLQRDGEQCRCLADELKTPFAMGQHVPLDDCTRPVLQQRQALVIEDLASDARGREAFAATGIRSLLLWPVDGDPAVALGIYWNRPQSVAEVERALLSELCALCAAALENARVFAALTERTERRTQDLLAANRELERFSYSVAHDLRSPLTCVVGFADLLERKYAAGLDSKGRELLQEVVRSGQTMSSLIDGLLSLAQQGQGVPVREQVDLSTLAARVAEELLRAQPGRQVELRIEPGLTVNGDGTQLELVLHNLLDNALKYTSKVDRPRISLSRAEQQPHSYVVRDNGVGFDLAIAGRLFAPFQRLHSQAEYKGAGVGLASVARIVRKHGGNVWAEAEPGKGAAFFFSLPPEGVQASS